MRLLSCLVFFVVLTACSPAAQDHVWLTSPSLPGGRLCIHACAQSKEFAADRCRIEQNPCLKKMRQKAMADYDAYVQRQTASKARIVLRPSSFESAQACSAQACYQAVNTDYYDCYESCGGTVRFRPENL